MKKYLIVLSGIAVTACSTNAEITQAPIEYVKNGSFNSKAYVSDTSFEIRTFTKSSGSNKELIDVPCKFSGKGFQSRFNSPAYVTAPNFGTQTPIALLKCKYNEEEQAFTHEPYNQTIASIKQRNHQATANQGLIGALIGGIATGVQTSRRDPTKDVYAYRSKRITFGAKK
jgi:hypothetical protein